MFWKTSTYFSLILTRVVGYNSKKKKEATHMLFADMRHCLCVCDWRRLFGKWINGGDDDGDETKKMGLIACLLWKERGGVGEGGKRGNTLPPLGKRGWQSILDDSGHKGWRWKLVKLSLPRFGKHLLSDTPITFPDTFLLARRPWTALRFAL